VDVGCKLDKGVRRSVAEDEKFLRDEAEVATSDISMGGRPTVACGWIADETEVSLRSRRGLTGAVNMGIIA
jgi:hypothetical protein